MSGSKITDETPIPARALPRLAREMGLVRDRLRHFFREPVARTIHEPFGVEGLTRPLGWRPCIEAAEEEQEYVITAEVPGLAPDDVAVEYQNNSVTIRGLKAEERPAADAYRLHHLWERTYGAFSRTLALPRLVDTDRASAALANGVLTVRLPKGEGRSSAARRLEIASSP